AGCQGARRRSEPGGRAGTVLYASGGRPRGGPPGKLHIVLGVPEGGPGSGAEPRCLSRPGQGAGCRRLPTACPPIPNLTPSGREPCWGGERSTVSSVVGKPTPLGRGGGYGRSQLWTEGWARSCVGAGHPASEVTSCCP